ncbi:MAG: GspE/PulE family protein [Cyanobacteria bacterium REEB65]|nr:GspE/PulE family protein [Cyanobacteria bacterium REEB65]
MARVTQPLHTDPTLPDASVQALVDTIIRQALRDRASDIHLEPTGDGLIVRFRIDGLLRRIEHMPAHLAGVVVTRVKVMGDLDISERRAPQDGRRTGTFDGRKVDLRISTIPVLQGEKAVIRLLPQDTSFDDMEVLGFAPEAMRKYQTFLQHAQGLILITGPTGSGKTSTLYASLLQKRHETLNIVTIEDPIEYQLFGINQMQVHHKARLTFASGLRAILRQDPDIVMVGEIRDPETASIVFQSALTGHLVFSTMHTNDSVSAITRLLDLGVEPYLIGSALVGIAAQRLIRRICAHCREDYEPAATELESLRLEVLDLPGKLARGRGCPACFGTGYQGREAIFEILPLTDELREGILCRASEQDLRRMALSQGMEPLSKAGLRKVLEGTTTPSELLRVVRL